MIITIIIINAIITPSAPVAGVGKNREKWKIGQVWSSDVMGWGWDCENMNFKWNGIEMKWQTLLFSLSHLKYFRHPKNILVLSGVQCILFSYIVL